jgi:transposase-like protein
MGIWAGLRTVYPDTQEQRCWNHRILNALDKVPKRLQATAPAPAHADPLRGHGARS